jgi:hypothetical protein
MHEPPRKREEVDNILISSKQNVVATINSSSKKQRPE